MLFYTFIPYILAQYTIDQFTKLVCLNDIVLLSSERCGHCRRAKSTLNYNNISYHNVDINENPNVWNWVSKKENVRHIPVAYYKNKFYKNFSDLKRILGLRDAPNPSK